LKQLQGDIPEGGRRFQSQELCNILWAINTEEEVVTHQEFFEVAASNIEGGKIQIREFNQQEISNLCWAYGSLLSDPLRETLPALLCEKCFSLLEAVSLHLLVQYQENQEIFCSFKSHERIQIGMSLIAKLILEQPENASRLIPSRARLLHALLDTSRGMVAELDSVEALVMQRILVQFGMERDSLYTNLQICRDRALPLVEHAVLNNGDSNHDIEIREEDFRTEEEKLEAVEEYAILEAEGDYGALKRDYLENEFEWE